MILDLLPAMLPAVTLSLPAALIAMLGVWQLRQRLANARAVFWWPPRRAGGDPIAPRAGDDASGPAASGGPATHASLTRRIAQLEAELAALRAEHQAASKLTMVARCTDNAVAVLSPEGVIEWANASFARLVGRPVEAVVGKVAADILPGQDPGADILASMHSLGNGDALAIEVWYGESAATAAWCAVDLQPVHDERGQITNIIFIGRDITRRKHAELELAETNLRLELEAQRAIELRFAAEAADRAKSAFLAIMSHEIRTPMNSILGMNDLLLQTELTADQRELAEGVERAGDILLALVNDILDLSKIEAGKVDLTHEEVDLRRVVSDVLQVCRPAATAKGIQLEAEIDPALPSTVLGDRARLRQILVNLVGNAVKFTGSGQVTVQVGHEPLADPARVRLHVEVTDTGPGVAPDVQERLFSPFVQVDTSTTRQHGGTGLGLAICKRLVELMGGEIGLRSEPGAGSTFWFTVTLQTGSATAADAAGESNVAPRPVEERSPSRAHLDVADDCSPLILYVDDSPANQDIGRRMLERLGCRVHAVGGGQEALAALAANEYAAVLMDCRMPGMDGFEATVALRAAERGRRHTPVLAMTADISSETAERCLAVGMDALLTKPVRLEQLATVLNRWLPQPIVSTSPDRAATAVTGSNAPEAPPIGAPPESGTPPPAPFGAITPAALENLRRLQGPGRPDVVKAFAARFLEHGPALIGKMKDAVAGQQLDTLGLLAHTLRGDAASWGAERLAAACRRLEQTARSESESLGVALADVEGELATLLGDLRSLLGGEGNNAPADTDRSPARRSPASG